jgi:hypothetical protein
LKPDHFFDRVFLCPQLFWNYPLFPLPHSNPNTLTPYPLLQYFLS